MKISRLFLLTFFLFMILLPLSAQDRVVLEPDTPEGEIIHMDPAEVDASRLPLNSVEELRETGTVPDIKIRRWRLTVAREEGEAASFTYRELMEMETVRKKVLLICPGWFADHAEWEGVPLELILENAGIGSDYSRIVVHGSDGYNAPFSREEVERGLLFLAYRVNGEDLPPEHGFPVRLVAEDILGGRWVKWVSRIEVN